MIIITSLLRRINSKINNVQKKTSMGVRSATDALFRCGVIILVSILIVWVSIFLYTAFYYAYMPSMSHVRPVHLQFKSCNKEKGICSFPSAHVQLTKKQQLLMVGQPYKVNLHLEMPESSVNKELGMFMVCADLKSRDNVLVEHACRSAMLHYRSTLLHTLTTLTFSPLLIFGNSEEKQNVILELFGNFEEDQSHPVTRIYIEIQSMHIEFYSASLIINAHLSGLRYLMFHWPVLSAIVGTCTNLFFIALICTLSYLHFAFEEDNTNEDFTYQKGEEDDEEEHTNQNKTSSSDILSFEDSVTEYMIKRQDEDQPVELPDPSDQKPSYVQELSRLLD